MNRRVLVGKPPGKWPLERQKRPDDIKIDLRDTGHDIGSGWN